MQIGIQPGAPKSRKTVLHDVGRHMKQIAVGPKGAPWSPWAPWAPQARIAPLTSRSSQEVDWAWPIIFSCFQRKTCTHILYLHLCLLCFWATHTQQIGHQLTNPNVFFGKSGFQTPGLAPLDSFRSSVIFECIHVSGIPIWTQIGQQSTLGHPLIKTSKSAFEICWAQCPSWFRPKPSCNIGVWCGQKITTTD